MKIGLIGSAPSSIRLAPYSDKSWTLWGCSPGAYPIVERADAWFELHRYEPPVIGDPAKQVPWFSPEYVEWLKLLHEHDCPVYMTERVPEVPSSVRYPRERVIAEFGEHFLTSSLALMAAVAILKIEDDWKVRENFEEDAIGFWGVDMAATEEYSYQRPGCQFFIREAEKRGIRVVLPPESDLNRPMPIYGLHEWSHAQIKTLARQRELEGRLNAAIARRDGADKEVYFLQGALDDLKYMRMTWIPSEPDIEGTTHL